MSFFTLFKNFRAHFSKLYGLRKVKSLPQFDIVRACNSDYIPVCNHLWKTYYTDEPSNKALGTGIQYTPVFDNLTKDVLTQGYSLMAKCNASGELAGLAINEVATKDDTLKMIDLAKKQRDRKVRNLFLWWAYIHEYGDLYRSFGTDKIYEVQSVSVDQCFRDRGLGSLLIKNSISIGKKNFKVVRVDATNKGTSIICKRLQMNLVGEIPFKGIKTPEGEPLFENPPKHNVEIYVKLQPIRSKKDAPFMFLRANLNDYSAISSLLWTSFHPEESITKSLNLGNSYNPIMDDVAMKTLTQGYSIVARSKENGKIVGAALNQPIMKWDPEKTLKFCKTLPCVNTRRLYEFYAYLKKSPKLFERLHVDVLFDVQNVVVDKMHRKKGVGTYLIEESRRLGRESGFEVVRVDGNHPAIQKICEKLKMIQAFEMRTEQYLGEDKNPIFNIQNPFNIFKTYIDIPEPAPEKVVKDGKQLEVTRLDEAKGGVAKSEPSKKADPASSTPDLTKS